MTKGSVARAVPSLGTMPILIAVIATLYFAREILIPLAFAVTLAMILAPAVGWLMRLHIGRAFASLIMVIVSIAGAAAISYIIFNQLVQVLVELPSYRDNIHNKIQSVRAPSTGDLGKATENVKEISKELANEAPAAPAAPSPAAGKSPVRRTIVQPDPAKPVPVQIVAEPASAVAYFRNLTQPFLAPLGTLGIVLIFTVFLLIEQEDLRNRLFRLAGLNRLNLMTQALDDATRRVSRYLMLQFLVNACFGILFGAGLYFIGVPYAALWGTVAAIFRIVPYVGSAAAGLLPLLLSLAVFDKWMPPLLVFAMFVVLELVTANFIEPLLYGTHTGISALALLVTTVFWTTLWGPAGLVLSTPLTVCLVVLGRHVPQFSFLHVLLGDEPVLTSEAQLCQRLLAMDDQGARAVMDQYLESNPLPQLYDAVVIPALAVIEKDRHHGTLDADREEFIFLTIREMLSDFAEKVRSAEPVDNGLDLGTSGRVLCIPAAHESDEIALGMLAQLLEPSGCPTIVFPLDASLQPLEHVLPEEDDTFFISALPPLAFSRARSITSTLRRRFPKTKIVVGLWGYNGDTGKALQRFQPFLPDRIAVSLAAAIEYISESGAAENADETVVAAPETVESRA